MSNINIFANNSANSNLNNNNNNNDNNNIFYNVANENYSFKKGYQLLKITLFNFKSFKNKHDIGYFQDFSCVIGSNGSGKSNISESIIFALGNNSKNIRSESLINLINRDVLNDAKYNYENNIITNNTAIKNKKNKKNTDISESVFVTCYVEVYFVRSDYYAKIKNQAKINNNYKLFEDISLSNMIVIKREFSLDVSEYVKNNNKSTIKQSEYYYNNKKVSFDNYSQKLLNELNIYNNCLFFYVAQGSIYNLISSKKNFITNYIDILSSSNTLQPKYDQVNDELNKVISDITQMAKQIESVKIHHKEIKEIIDSEDKYNTLDFEINKLLNKIFLYKLLENDNIITNSQNELKDYDKIMNKTNEDYKQKEAELKHLQEQLRNEKQKIQDDNNNNNRINNIYQELKLKLNKSHEELNKQEDLLKDLQSKIINKISQLHKEKNDKEKRDIIKTDLEKALVNLEKENKDITLKISNKFKIKLENKQQEKEFKEITEKIEEEFVNLYLDKDNLTKYLINNVTNLKSLKIKEIENTLKLFLNKCNDLITSAKTNEYNDFYNNTTNLLNNICNLNSLIDVKEYEEIFINTKEVLNKERIVLKKKLNDYDKIIDNYSNELNSLNNNKLTLNNQTKELETSLNEVSMKIRSFESKAIDFEKRKKIDTLKKDLNLISLNNDNSSKYLKGIYGFVCDLINVNNKNLDTAVKVSLLRYLNHLVVDTVETARFCTEYFKENDISIDLIIIENILSTSYYKKNKDKFTNDNNEYNNQDDTNVNFKQYGAYLSSFIIYKIPEIKVVVDYFIRDIVFCNNVNYVNNLYNMNIKNIILEDGTILKQGAITGGKYKNLESYEFRQEDLNNLKKEYNANEDNLTNKYNEINNIIKTIQQIEFKTNEINLSKNIINDLLSTNENKLNNLESLFNNSIISSINIYNNEFNRLNIEENDYNIKIQNINNTLKSYKEEKFKSFFKKYNISNNDKNMFDDINETDLIMFDKELKANNDKIFKIKSSLNEYEIKNNNLINIQKAYDEDKKLKDDFLRNKEILKNNYKNIKQEYDELTSIIESNKEAIKNLSEQILDKENSLDNIKERISSLMKRNFINKYNISNCDKKKKDIINEFKNNISSYFLKYNTCLVMNYNINIEEYIINYNDVFISSETNSNYNANNIINSNSHQSKLSQVSDNYNNESSYINDSTNSNFDVYNINNIKVDYSSINDEVDPSEKLNKLEKKLKLIIEEKETYVNNMLKNTDDYDKLKEKHERVKEEKALIENKISKLVFKKEELTKEISLLKKERKEKFNLFLNQLSEEVQSIYKSISYNSYLESNSVEKNMFNSNIKNIDNINNINNKINIKGGSANLYNTNPDEPYLGETIYLPTPPGKSYVCEFESLSGGEKTVAIVSLIIALMKIINCPFIILDEIDCFLDAIHDNILEKLILSIKDICNNDYDQQVILTTHKFLLFKDSNSLMGIYYNSELKSSISISLNLNQFEDENNNEALNENITNDVNVDYIDKELCNRY